MTERYIMHIDMDAFFAAVEQHDDPTLKGRPVVIGSDPKGGKGRGVVSTCSYEARAFGIRSAMPISEAYRRCSHAVFLRGDIKKYAQVSQDIMAVLYDFTPDIEPISIDEAFCDITASWHLFGSPQETCMKIKKRIVDEVGLTSSIGLAPIKMAAKIASDMKKPDGFVQVAQGQVKEFLAPLPIRVMWGVGPKAEQTLQRLGIRTIGALAAYNVTVLEQSLGAHAIHLWQLANGIDERDVAPCDSVQSVSNEYTFEQDVPATDEVESTLLFLSEKVSRRLRKQALKGKTVTLKIRFSDFKTYSRSETLAETTNFCGVIYNTVKTLYHEFQDPRKYVRLVGVKVSRFADTKVQAMMLWPEHGQQEAKHVVMDKIKDKYGESAICHARTKA